MLGTKRKRTIDDYFTTSHTKPKLPSDDIATQKPITAQNRMASKPHGISNEKQNTAASTSWPQRISTGATTTKVPGLTLHDDFISPAEEENILSFLSDPSRCTWRSDLSRRSMHFGGTYCLFTPPGKPKSAVLSSSSSSLSSSSSSSSHTTATRAKQPQPKPEIVTAPPMPQELTWLLDRLESQGIFGPDQRPQYCIVNEYHDRLGISAHVENFSFAEPVVGLSLLSPVSMRFSELVRPDGGSVRSGKAAKAERTGRREDVWLRGRGLCVMRGESRWRWQHEILRSGRGRGPGWRRVSLTFRFKPGENTSGNSEV